MKKLISFWKQVKERSSDMFTLFRVGIGVKVPTNKLHIKDSKDPLKIEGLQNDTTDPDKFITIDSNNIVKYRTGAQLASDIEVSIDDLHGAGVDGAANQLLTDNGDGTVTSESTLSYTPNILSIGSTDGSSASIRVPAHDNGDGAHLSITAGSATEGQTNKSGGILSFYSGQGTGNADSSEIRFYTYPDGGVSGTGIVSTAVRAATVTNNSQFRLDGGVLSGATDGDLSILSDGNISFILDVDNDETSSFSFMNGLSTEIANLNDSGDLQIDGDLTVSGGDITGPTDADLSISSDDDMIFTVDADGDGTPSFLFKDRTAELASIDMAPGEATIHVGPDDDSLAVIRRKTHSDDDGGELNISGGDATGTNKTGGNLNLLGGRGTGSGAGGQIRFFSHAAGSSGSTAGSLVEIATLDGLGNLQIDGGLTTGSTSAINSSGLIQVANQSNITGVGTISSGTWQGTAIASAYLDADTSHLSATQTMTGRKLINIRQFDVTSSTDGAYNGDVIFVGTGSTVLGKIHTLRSDGAWIETDADSSYTTGFLAVALGTDPDVDGMLIRGMVTLSIEIAGTEAVGNILYVDGATAGAATVTAPSGTGDYVRVIGYVMGTDDQIYFNPDNAWVEIA